MEKELIEFYLKKISLKLQWILNNNDAIRNEILIYIEICIDICNLLEKRYYRAVNEERETFQNIQATILEKDYFNALEYTNIKIKELEMQKAHI